MTGQNIDFARVFFPSRVVLSRIIPFLCEDAATAVSVTESRPSKSYDNSQREPFGEPRGKPFPKYAYAYVSGERRVGWSGGYGDRYPGGTRKCFGASQRGQSCYEGPAPHSYSPNHCRPIGLESPRVAQ